MSRLVNGERAVGLSAMISNLYGVMISEGDGDYPSDSYLSHDQLETVRIAIDMAIEDLKEVLPSEP